MRSFATATFSQTLVVLQEYDHRKATTDRTRETQGFLHTTGTTLRIYIHFYKKSLVAPLWDVKQLGVRRIEQPRGQLFSYCAGR